MADQVEALLREYTTKLRAVFRSQLEEDVTAAVRKAISGGSTGSRSTSARATKLERTIGRAKPSRGGNARGGKRTPEQIVPR